MGFIKRALKKVKDVASKIGWAFLMFAFKRKVLETTYHTVSVVATGAVLYYLLPLWMALAILGILYTHEMGHYFQARRLRRDAWLPFFIPWFFGASGHTPVKAGDPAIDARIALAGPTVGMIVSLLGLAAAIGFGFVPAMWFTGWMFVIQVFQGTFGSDGRRYRKARALAGFLESEAGSAAPIDVTLVPQPA